MRWGWDCLLCTDFDGRRVDDHRLWSRGNNLDGDFTTFTTAGGSWRVHLVVRVVVDESRPLGGANNLVLDVWCLLVKLN